MFNSKIDLNEIKVNVRFETKYNLYTSTIKTLLDLLERVYNNIEEWENESFLNKYDIDLNILKAFIERFKIHYNEIEYLSSYFDELMEKYKKEKSVSKEEYLFYCHPNVNKTFQITGSELMVIYKTLNYCKDYHWNFLEHVFIGDLHNYKSFIEEIQKYLESRFAYALLEK